MDGWEIRKIRADGSSRVVDSSSFDASDHDMADVTLRGMLAHGRFLSACSEWEYTVTRQGVASEIAHYCGGKRVR